jgi:hypothetical protein
MDGVKGKSGAPGGGYVAQLARSVGVYGRPMPRMRGGEGRSGNRRRGEGGRKTDILKGPPSDWEAPAPNFSDKERDVIANLEEYSAEGLLQLSESLQESCNTKIDELKDARAEKAQLQEELQGILAILADGTLSSQSAIKAGHADRMFIKKVVAKYRRLVEHFETKKQEADLSDRTEYDAIRKLIVRLHEQMHMTQVINKVLDETEKVRTSTAQLETLLDFHRTDLRIVQTGSRQVLAKAQAHKDALFQALVGLEYRLVRARGQRQERSKELRVSKQQQDAIAQRLLEEEQAVLEREVVWLQDQLAIARHASKDGHFHHDKAEKAVGFKKMGPAGTSGEVSETGGFAVQALQLQIDQLERELAEVQTTSIIGDSNSPASKRVRPPTAGVDGRDYERQRQARREQMTSQLHALRVQLASSLTESGPEDNVDLLSRIKELEAELQGQDEGYDMIEDSEQLMEELDELDNMLAGKASKEIDSKTLAVIKMREVALEEVRSLQRSLLARRAELRHSLDDTTELCNSFVERLHDFEIKDMQAMETSLASKLLKSSELAAEAEEMQNQIDELLPVAEGRATRAGAEQDLDEDEANQVLEGLQAKHRILERDVRILSERNNVSLGQLNRIKSLVGNVDFVAGNSVEPPSLETTPLPDEHIMRKGLADHHSQGHQRQNKTSKRDAITKVTADNVAQLAAIWKMEQGDAPLSWIPRLALTSPLPPGWEQRVDFAGYTYYIEKGSGISTWEHPNDTKYKGIYMEIKSRLESVDDKDLGFSADCLEAERLRLREVGASIEQQTESLRRREAEMQQENLLAAISQEENSTERELAWEKRRDEVLKAEVNRLRHNQGVKLQESREILREELRVKLVEQERASIRRHLHDDQKTKLAAEQLRIREKLLKDEMSAARNDMRLQEQISLQTERQAIRAEILSQVKQAAETEVQEKDTSARGMAVAELEGQLRDLRHKTDMDRQRGLSKNQDSDEIVEYAHYLGMDPVGRPDLLWIAHLALTAPLPAGWSEHFDADGNVFFYCQSSGQSTYEHPMDSSFKAYYSKQAARQTV